MMKAAVTLAFFFLSISYFTSENMNQFEKNKHKFLRISAQHNYSVSSMREILKNCGGGDKWCCRLSSEAEVGHLP